MADYAAWNKALIEYFTYGAPVGSTIYLNVNERVLNDIGTQIWGEPPEGGWGQDYIHAIRRTLVHDACVRLDLIHGVGAKGYPQGVAFLGLLVLIASRMERDLERGIQENDYWTPLNEALGTVPTNAQIRRPRYMSTGAGGEEPLWLAWADFLRSRGYLPTASGGKSAWKYIGYAVSQTLIREAEKRRLFQVFEAKGWHSSLDPEVLLSALRYEAQLPAHLRSLMTREGLALEDVQYALNEVYREWQEQGGNFTERSSEAGKPALSRQLQAGLYRTEHYRTGETQYSLFPRQPRGVRLLNVSVNTSEGLEKLVIERPGYYAPFSDVSGNELHEGVRLSIQGHPLLDTLQLPARDFWLLRADPDNPGAFASLGRAGVGEHFFLLIQDELKADLEHYRDEGLLQWATTQPWEKGWWEFGGVMVTANHWEVAGIRSRELLDALRPTLGLSLSLSGGLRIPHTGAWLVDGPPRVTVGTFFSEATLTLRQGKTVLFEQSVEPNQPLSLPWPGKGEFELEAEMRGQGQVRLVRLVDWDDLPAPASGNLGQVTQNFGISGLRWVGVQAQTETAGQVQA